VVILKQSVLWSSLAVCILLPLGACSSSPWASRLEQSLAADPRLQVNNQANPAPESPTGSETAQLPANFPAEIPRYPNAELLSVSGATSSDNPVAGSAQPVQTRWRTTDTAAQVQQFYRDKFQSGGWQVGGAGSADRSNPSSETNQPLQATQDGLQVSIATAEAGTPSPSANGTEFTLSYQFSDSASAASPTVSPSDSPTANAGVGTSTAPKPGESGFVGPVWPESQSASNPTTNAGSFTDLKQAPPELQSYITDLAKLGVLPAASTKDPNLFKPNAEISRRDYARWLVAANNRIYSNQASRQIRLAATTEKPLFQDVPSSDPDFGAIQGLANAGLISSPLSGDAAAVNFRPDAPLTREDLILWKVPVDLRQALPNASIDTIQQTWGFQDTAKIDPKAMRAVLADYQNGDLSNIRRAFGYTTLFQPKKSVSRSEAAAVLWQFGSQGNNLSAKDALQTASSTK
jgi:hypothetical protein